MINFDQQKSADLATFILRVSLGVVLIAHSLYLKYFVFTLAGTASFFGSIGLYEWLAYVVFFLEIIVGFALILGFQTRLFAAIIVPVLLGATWAHWPNGWLFTAPNGGWEYPLYLTITSVCVALLGDGAYSVKKALLVKQEHQAQSSSA